MTTAEKVMLTAGALSDKKAVDVKAVKINDLSVLTDYMVFAGATSSTHIRALADAVEQKLSQNGLQPHHSEGKATGWFLLDYTDFIVHIFTPDAREFYNLEKLWGDGEPVDLSSVLD